MWCGGFVWCGFAFWGSWRCGFTFWGFWRCGFTERSIFAVCVRNFVRILTGKTRRILQVRKIRSKAQTSLKILAGSFCKSSRVRISLNRTLTCKCLSENFPEQSPYGELQQQYKSEQAFAQIESKFKCWLI